MIGRSRFCFSGTLQNELTLAHTLLSSCIFRDASMLSSNLDLQGSYSDHSNLSIRFQSKTSLRALPFSRLFPAHHLYSSSQFLQQANFNPKYPPQYQPPSHLCLFSVNANPPTCNRSLSAVSYTPTYRSLTGVSTTPERRSIT